MLLLGSEGDTDPAIYREVVGRSAEEVLAGSRAVLADAAAGERAVRFALTRAVESLEDVLRVAVSRGQRIDT